MISGNYLCVTSLGDIGTTHTELMNAAMSFRNSHGICLLKYFHKEEEKSESDGLIALLSHYLATCQQSI